MVALRSIMFVIGAIIVLVAIAGVVMMSFHVLSMCSRDKDCGDPASTDDTDIPESAKEYRIGAEEPYDVVDPKPGDGTTAGGTTAGAVTNPNDDGRLSDGGITMTAESAAPAE